MIFILRTRLMPWSCFPSFITGRKVNVYICSTRLSACAVVKKHKSCIRTDLAADQNTSLASPAAYRLIYLVCQRFTLKSCLGRPLTIFSLAALYRALLTKFSPLHPPSRSETKFRVHDFGNWLVHHLLEIQSWNPLAEHLHRFIK